MLAIETYDGALTEFLIHVWTGNLKQECENTKLFSLRLWFTQQVLGVKSSTSSQQKRFCKSICEKVVLKF